MKKCWALLLCVATGCSTHPWADFLDAFRPGNLGPTGVNPYGGVCIPQGPVSIPMMPAVPITLGPETTPLPPAAIVPPPVPVQGGIPGQIPPQPVIPGR